MSLTFEKSGAIILEYAAQRGKRFRKETPKLASNEHRRCLFMYAIIATGGKQYKVAEGDVIKVERLGAAAGEAVTFDQVLAVLDGENTKIGAPTVEGASVEAKVVKNGKGKKIVVFKYRPKKDSKSIRGHRQPYTKVEITKIAL